MIPQTKINNILKIKYQQANRMQAKLKISRNETQKFIFLRIEILELSGILFTKC